MARKSLVRHQTSTLQDIVFMVLKFYSCIYAGQDVSVLEAHACVTSPSTVRHKECQIIMSADGTGVRCQQSVCHHATLLLQHQCIQSSSGLNSSVNHRYLSMPQLASRLQNVHRGHRLASKQCEWLMKKLEEECFQ